MHPQARGVSFQIPNEYGHWLARILNPVNYREYDWLIGGGESYRWLESEQELEELFPGNLRCIGGEALARILEAPEPQYIIHADLKAFPPGKPATECKTYDEFVSGDCLFVLIIVDSTYAMIYCKDRKLLASLHNHLPGLGAEEVQVITEENDFRTRLSVW